MTKSAFKKLTVLLMALMLALATFGCSSDSDKGDEKESVEGSDATEPQNQLKDAEVGDYITFGTYEQDNNTSNGKEAIEWLVLDVQDGKALVISKYALDAKPYNTSSTDVTWETCSLRSWLNGEFINEAFSVDEQAKIPAVTVSADENPEHDTDPGNETQDKVFLLSIAETGKYFSSREAKKCKPTAYAVANGVYESGGISCSWWLRSPGNHQSNAVCIDVDGDVGGHGYYVIRDDNAVRPALWINL